MSEARESIFTKQGMLKSFALTCGICFAFSGIALAQTDNCSTEATRGWSIDNPAVDDRLAIADVLSGYAWAIDERNAAAFAAMFAEPGSSYYELCDTGGSIFKFILGLGPQSPDDLLTQMGIIAGQLEVDNLRVRHLVTNTLYDKLDDKTVITKSTVLVTVQAAGYPTPNLDYSADARATLVKGDDNTWRFQWLTIHADYAPAGDGVAKKR